LFDIIKILIFYAWYLCKFCSHNTQQHASKDLRWTRRKKFVISKVNTFINIVTTLWMTMPLRYNGIYNSLCSLRCQYVDFNSLGARVTQTDVWKQFESMQQNFISFSPFVSYSLSLSLSLSLVVSLFYRSPFKYNITWLIMNRLCNNVHYVYFHVRAWKTQRHKMWKLVYGGCYTPW
jgi:hypothetical protein